MKKTPRFIYEFLKFHKSYDTELNNAKGSTNIFFAEVECSGSNPPLATLTLCFVTDSKSLSQHLSL